LLYKQPIYQIQYGCGINQIDIFQPVVTSKGDQSR